MIPRDSGLLRAGLLHAEAALLTVVDDRRADAARPPEFAEQSWRGPAAAAAGELQQRLRAGLVAAAGATEAALYTVRTTLALLDA